MFTLFHMQSKIYAEWKTHLFSSDIFPGSQ